MRKFTVIAAAAASILAGSALSANADYNAGGPVKKGKMCWFSTSGVDHGYWGKCPKPAKAMRKAGKKAAKKK